MESIVSQSLWPNTHKQTIIFFWHSPISHKIYKRWAHFQMLNSQPCLPFLCIISFSFLSITRGEIYGAAYNLLLLKNCPKINHSLLTCNWPDNKRKQNHGNKSKKIILHYHMQTMCRLEVSIERICNKNISQASHKNIKVPILAPLIKFIFSSFFNFAKVVSFIYIYILHLFLKMKNEKITLN